MAALKGSEEKPVELDEVLKKFSLFGKYYGPAIILIFLAYATNNMFCANYVFVAREVSYRCKDESFGNNTCSHPTNSSIACTEWIYDNPDSFVAEFQLACQEWKRTLVGTAHSFGNMVGLLIVGPLSDKFGRKMMAVTTGVLGGILGLARSFTSWYWMYIALEFLESALGDICSPVYMLCIEMVPNEKRLIFTMLCTFGYTGGALNLSLMAWLVPYWRNLLRVLYAPALLFFFYLFLLEESPRWLLSKGKKDKAVKILKKIADSNKVKLDENMLDKLTCEVTKGVSLVVLLKDTFASGALLKRFFICLTWWTTSTFVNYGMTINSVSLEGNKYLNYALVAIVDIPGAIVTTYVMIRYKRKLPLIFSFIAAAILCLTQPFVPKNLPWLSILLYTLGKLMSSAYFSITYLFTSELFPTYTRNSMHALCSSLGRVGSIIAPQTPLLMHYWPGLPSIIFGSASLLAGLATFFVPDTSDDALPDTVRQAEAIGKSSKVARNKIVPIEKTESFRL